MFMLIFTAIFPSIKLLTELIALAMGGFLFADFYLLFRVKQGFNLERKMANRFSNGDENPVEIKLHSHYQNTIQIRIIDELPLQFQERNFHFDRKVEKNESFKISYSLRPVLRGIYNFGKVHIFINTKIGLLERHLKFKQETDVAVYPSFHQLKQIEMLSFAEMKNLLGLKKIRHIGYNKEFEQVKNYVIGDEIKHINWKATARKNKLMVNQYQDEKSQYVYCMIDMGRTMEMPFNGLSLLDYSINASLAISQIILKNSDEAGLITYDKKIRSVLPASKKSKQLNLMLESLYGQKTNFDESSLEPVYSYIQRKIRQRSLLIFFINFESIYSLKRNLALFKRLSKSHLVLLVSYKNTEIEKLTTKAANDIDGIYLKTIAENFLYEKRTFLKELSKYGIHTLFAAPEEVNIQTINKYLEIKARGLL